MLYQRQCQHYKKMQVETAPPERLVMMLYDGALKFLGNAVRGIENNDWEVANSALVRGQAIITELRCALDHQTGDVAVSLDQLYGYMQDRLVEANVHKRVAEVNEVIGLLSSLKDTWSEVIQQSENQSDSGAEQ